MAGVVGNTNTGGSSPPLTTTMNRRLNYEDVQTYATGDVVTSVDIYVSTAPPTDDMIFDVGLYETTDWSADHTDGDLVWEVEVTLTNAGGTGWFNLPISNESISGTNGKELAVAITSRISGSQGALRYATSGNQSRATAGQEFADPWVEIDDHDEKLALTVTTEAASSGPTITGPTAVVDGASDTVDGTDFDNPATVDIQLTGDSGSAVVQVTGTQDTTSIDITVRNVVTEPTLGSPQDAIPFTILDDPAADYSAYTLEFLVTNDDTTTDTNVVTLEAETTLQTIQAMTSGADTAVTTEGSVFDTTLITVTDDMQATVPLNINGATITLLATGVYGHDSDTEIVLPVKYYDLTTTQLSYAEITLSAIFIAPVMPASDTGSVTEPSQVLGTYDTSNTPNPAAVYTISGTDSGVLSINNSTGAVTADNPTDEGVKNTYVFTVTSTNSEGSDNTNVTFTINELGIPASAVPKTPHCISAPLFDFI